MPNDDKRHNHSRISPRVIGAVAGMWGGLLPSPSARTIDQILLKNSIDPRNYAFTKGEKVLRSLQDAGAQTAAQLIRDLIKNLKAEGHFASEDPKAISNFEELQSAFESVGAELTNSGDLIWDSEDLQPDSFVTIDGNGQTWTYDENDQEIGKGGYGIVYLGWDDDGREVAVKRVPLSQGGDERQLYREYNNAQALREQDPGTVENVLIPIAEVADSKNLYIIMPYAQDGSLKKKLATEGKLTTEEALDTLEQITKGLNELLIMGVLHRDVKTDNVLYQDKKWKLSDFGLSRFIENDTASYTVAFKGSTGYTAPEVINQQQKTVHSDLYSVGVIAYEMLAGRRPFTGDKDQVRDETLNLQPPSLPDEIPGSVRRIVSRLLKKDPAARYVDPRQLLEAIDHAKKNTGKSSSRFAHALSVHEAKEEATRIQHELQRQKAKQLGDRKTQAINDLDEKINQAVEISQADEPSISLNFNEKLNVWHINGKAYGLALAIWDEITEAPGEHMQELLHSGEIYLLPEPQTPKSAYAMNGMVRENRIPDSNLVCVANSISGIPEWFLFSVNDAATNAHGFNRASFEQHWKKANKPGVKVFDYTNNTDPLSPEALIDLLIHAVEGRYVEAHRSGI